MSAIDRSGSIQHLSLRVKELDAEIARTRAAVICAFNQLLDLKDLNTGCHSTRLAEWGVRVARSLGVGESCLRDVEIAALLHDIGKIGIPDAILHKPGRLDEEERRLMDRHPEYGWAILRRLPDFERASLFVLHHHESWDGTGYPAGLAREEVPLPARIVSVIDAFDAMTSDRPYRKGLPVDEALRRLVASKHTQFDPQVVDCFVRSADAAWPEVVAATGTGVNIAV